MSTANPSPMVYVSTGWYVLGTDPAIGFRCVGQIEQSDSKE